MKIEITRLRKESSTQNDASSKTQKDYIRVDKEKKEGIQKIQSMHNEIRDLKSKLQDYEAGKVQDVKKLEDSLTETLKSNKKVQEALEQDKVMIAELEAARKKMGDELTEVKKDKQKVETDQKNLQGLLDKKKQAERELESMIKDFKEKIDKYDVDKKSVMKMEKAKRDAATAKHEQEKKELEDKVEKMKVQWEKVAIESKRKMSRLEEDAGGIQNVLADSRAQIEQKEEEHRVISKKLQGMEKDMQKLKAQHKTDSDRKDADLEGAESKLNDTRRNNEIMKKTLFTTDLELKKANNENKSLVESTDRLKTDVATLKKSGDASVSKVMTDKNKIDDELKATKLRLANLDTEKTKIEAQMTDTKRDLEEYTKQLKNDMKIIAQERDEMSEKLKEAIENANKEVEGDLKQKNEEIKDKSKMINEVRQELLQREKQFSDDLTKLEKAHKGEIEKLNSEINDVKTKIKTKEESISKLEKDKREANIARDKANKGVETARNDRDKVRQDLEKLETEKRSNNFGRYEKEKMKTEMDGLHTERQKLVTNVETQKNEISLLKSKIEEMGKGGKKTEQDLHKKNTSLISKVSSLEGNVKQLEASLNSEKGSYEEKIKSFESQIKSLSTEKGVLSTEINNIKSRESNGSKELEKTKSNLQNLEKEKSILDKKLSQLQKDHLSTAAMKGGDQKAQQEKINSLSKEKDDLDKKFGQLCTEKNELQSKLKPLEQEKSTLTSKVATLENEKKLLNKRLEETISKASKNSSASSNNLSSKDKEELKKVQGEIQKFQKECQSSKKEKGELCKKFQALEKELKKTVKDIQPKKAQASIQKIVESIEKNTLVQKLEPEEDLVDPAEMVALAEELEELVVQLEVKCNEVDEWKSNFNGLQTDISEHTSELENVTSQLQKSKHDGNLAVEKLKKSEDELALIKEKNAQLSDELLSKSRQITATENTNKGALRKTSAPAMTSNISKPEGKVIEELRKEIVALNRKIELAAKPPLGNVGGAKKKSVKFAAEPETVIATSDTDTSTDAKVARLQKELEEAANERKEILRAAEQEIEYHRSIACELEQGMLEDFEWKLHEIEADYHRKLKENLDSSSSSNIQTSTSKLNSRKTSTGSLGGMNGSSIDGDTFEKRLREAKNEIGRQKDEELAKMHIQIRKEMDDKLRLERNSLKTALDSAHGNDKEKAVADALKQKERDIKSMETHFNDERTKLQTSINDMKRQVAEKEQQIIRSVNEARKAGDQKVYRVNCIFYLDTGEYNEYC